MACELACLIQCPAGLRGDGLASRCPGRRLLQRRAPFLTLLSPVDSTATIPGNFGDAIYWGGVAKVTDIAGHPVVFSASAESGLEYSHAASVPEPTTAMLMLSGVVGLPAWRRHTQS